MIPGYQVPYDIINNRNHNLKKGDKI